MSKKDASGIDCAGVSGALIDIEKMVQQTPVQFQMGDKDSTRAEHGLAFEQAKGKTDVNQRRVWKYS